MSSKKKKSAAVRRFMKFASKVGFPPTGLLATAKPMRSFLVAVNFDIGAFSMKEAQAFLDRVLGELNYMKAPYVFVKDKDSGLAYEHFADGRWKKRKP